MHNGDITYLMALLEKLKNNSILKPSGKSNISHLINTISTHICKLKPIIFHLTKFHSLINYIK